MLYFFPSWYKENSYCENEQFWYKRRMRSEFDETIKQIQLFHRNVKVPYKVVVLSYAPNLRHFLHRQSLFRAPYWSIFDSIQQIKRNRIAVLSFHNFNWPKGVEFIYSPFVVLVYKDGKRYASVEFGENGNPISADMYEGELICRRNYYDDRGFVSSTVLYEEGKIHHQDYLDESGSWKIREFASDGHVEINPNKPMYDLPLNDSIKEFRFTKMHYNSIEKVIEEVLRRFVYTTTSKDKFITAVHPLHADLLNRVFADKYLIETFFENRFHYNQLGNIQDFLNHANYIITDSKRSVELIKPYITNQDLKLIDISPYDTRMDFGISQQLTVQNILVPIDDLTEYQFEKLMINLCKYLLTNEKARVHLFTRNGEWNYDQVLLGRVEEILRKNDFDPRWAALEENGAVSENDLEEEEEENHSVKKFYVDACIDERTISKCLNEQRVILDIRGVSDVFLFVTAISKGVPRISTMEDQYFEHLKNGMLITNYDDIVDALSYYVDSFENWNDALVHCYEMGKEYTTGVLIDSWKEVLNAGR